MNGNRKHPRAAFHTEIWLGGAGDDFFTKARGTDLSEGGACIETVDGYPVGGALSLRFVLPGTGDQIFCAASVRNLRDGGAGIGVQFLDLSQEDRRLVAAIVSNGGHWQVNANPAH